MVLQTGSPFNILPNLYLFVLQWPSLVKFGTTWTMQRTSAMSMTSMQAPKPMRLLRLFQTPMHAHVCPSYSTHLKSLFNLFWGTSKCITEQMPILFVLSYYFLNPWMMLEIEVKVVLIGDLFWSWIFHLKRYITVVCTSVEVMPSSRTQWPIPKPIYRSCRNSKRCGELHKGAH